MCHSNFRTLKMWDSQAINCTHAECSCHSHRHEAAGHWVRKKNTVDTVCSLWCSSIPLTQFLTHTHIYTTHSSHSCLNSLCTVRKSIHCCLSLDIIWTTPYLNAGGFNDGHFIIYCDLLSCMSRPYCALWADSLFLSPWSLNISQSIQQNPKIESELGNLS